jgi:hypothetical protein
MQFSWGDGTAEEYCLQAQRRLDVRVTGSAAPLASQREIARQDEPEAPLGPPPISTCDSGRRTYRFKLWGVA